MDERSVHKLYPEWHIVREIGTGAFGKVYEIERELFGKTEKAALKCITIPQNSGDLEELYGNGYDDASIKAQYESYLSQIVGEYSIMAEMKGHSNIVYCDDVRYAPRENGIGWDITIKMELLTPLMNTLPAQIDEDMVVHMAKDLCQALSQCQDKGVIHRDIKPQNIFVSRTHDYKLGDFGIAKTVEHTTGGTKIGTYNYMAPEVFNNKPYNHTADICSLGLVMYWMLNDRRLPFLPAAPNVPTVSENKTARKRRFDGEKLPPPAHGSDGLKKIVLKACEFDPKYRFTSAKHMLDALCALNDPDTLQELLMQNAEDDTLELTEEATVVIPVNNGEQDPKRSSGNSIPSKEDAAGKTKKKTAVRAVSMILIILLLCCIPLVLRRCQAPAMEVILPDIALLGVGDHVEIPYEVKPEAEDDALVWECSDDTIAGFWEGTLIGRAAGRAEIKLTYRNAVGTCRIFVFGRELGDQLLRLTMHDWYYAADDLALFWIDGEIYIHNAETFCDESQLRMLELAAVQELGGEIRQGRGAWLDIYSDADDEEYVGSVAWAEDAEETGVIVVHNGKRTYLLNPEELEDPADVTQVLVLSATELTMAVEETVELRVKGIQADGSETEPENLKWTSSNTNVCTVENGVLTAVREGTAEITVSDGKVSANCLVTVTDPEKESATEETKPAQGNQGTTGDTGTTKPTDPPATKPPATEPPATEPPATEPPATEPPATEPAGEAPSGYSISVSKNSIFLYETFTVVVTPNVMDYTKIVIHAIDPTGGRWDFTLTGTNAQSLYVDDPNLLGTWTIYADVYNQYGVYYGGPSVTVRVVFL